MDGTYSLLSNAGLLMFTQTERGSLSPQLPQSWEKEMHFTVSSQRQHISSPSSSHTLTWRRVGGAFCTCPKEELQLVGARTRVQSLSLRLRLVPTAHGAPSWRQKSLQYLSSSLSPHWALLTSARLTEIQWNGISGQSDLLGLYSQALSGSSVSCVWANSQKMVYLCSTTNERLGTSKRSSRNGCWKKRGSLFHAETSCPN